MKATNTVTKSWIKSAMKSVTKMQDMTTDPIESSV